MAHLVAMDMAPSAIGTPPELLKKYGPVCSAGPYHLILSKVNLLSAVIPGCP
jgi:hypothetical protein